MPNQRSSEQPDATFARSFLDQSFQPRVPFDVEEEMCRLDDNIASLNDFGPYGMDFDLDGKYNDSIEHDFLSGLSEQFQISASMSAQNHGMPVGTAHMSHTSRRRHRSFNSGNQFSAPTSVQSDIISSRGNQLREHFGQITPPDDIKSESFTAPSPRVLLEAGKSQEEDFAKMNRTQRARNAANKRHSKATRRDSLRGNAVKVGEGSKVQKHTNLQREKNRVAATKCRAKKKANSEEMQQRYREESKTNSSLLRKIRELRDQKAFLRNSLLQHEPEFCQCYAVHRFNMVQAQQLAFGVGATVGQRCSHHK